MTENVWLTKLTRECPAHGTQDCRACNPAVPGLTALESVGTEAYFRAIIGEAKRATAKPESKPVMPSAKVAKSIRVVKRASDELAPQLCNGCGHAAHGDVWALSKMPVILCRNCSENAPEVRYSARESWGEWMPAKVGA